MHQYNLRSVRLLAQSSTDRDGIRSVRHQVFVQEQGVDESLEWSDQDDSFIYVLATDENQYPIGTGRVKVESETATIGRMAVLKDWRGRGVGSAILGRLLEIGTSEGARKFTLSAQVPAIPFYQSHGFVAAGEIYIDANIEHRRMSRET